MKTILGLSRQQRRLIQMPIFDDKLIVGFLAGKDLGRNAVFLKRRAEPPKGMIYASVPQK